MAKEVDLGPQEVASFPTYVLWGVTNVRVQNTGDVSTVVELAAGTGSESENLDPGKFKRFHGQWGGAVLNVSNASANPGSRLHVQVW